MSKENKNINITEQNILEGIKIISSNVLFSGINKDDIVLRKKDEIGKDIKAYIEVSKTQNTSRYGRYIANNYYRISFDYRINLNKNILLSPKNWAYIIAHLYFHLVFGHFEIDKVPCIKKIDIDGNEIKVPSFDKSLWCKACDIYIDRFLENIKFGDSLIDINA